MPELPEVEVTRATLAGRLCGATLRWVRLGKPLRWPLGCEPSILVGLRAGELVSMTISKLDMKHGTA